MDKNSLKDSYRKQEDLDPLLIMSIYNLLKNEAKYELKSKILTIKIKKALKILEDEMFNVENTPLFKRILSKMIQGNMINLDQEKIIFKK